MAFREASQDTSAAPDKVWRVWSDVNHWPEWNPDMKESRLDGPLKLGATGMINTRSGGKHDVVVTHFEEGRSFELESTAARDQDGDPRDDRLQGRRESDHAGIRTSRVAGPPGRADDERPDPQDLQRCARRFEEEGGGGSLVSAGVSTRPSSLRGRHAIVSSAMKVGPFLIALEKDPPS